MRTPNKHRDTELLRKIGGRIREYRQQKGHSQAELANLCDIELSTLNRIKLGKSSPSITLLFVIADQLQVKPEDLVSVK